MALLELLATSGHELDLLGTAAVLRRLPGLLAEEVVPLPSAGGEKGTDELQKRLAAGECVETPALPSRPSRGPAAARGDALCGYLWVHRQLEDALCDARRRGSLPLSWLADVAHFVGAVRLSPPLSRQALELAADQVLDRLQGSGRRKAAAELALMARFARGAACSGALAEPASGALVRHALWPALGEAIATALKLQRSAAPCGPGLPCAALHDAALALALARPWDDALATAAARLLRMLPSGQELVAVASVPQPSPAVAAAASSGPPAAAGASRAGARGGQEKENQDAFCCCLHEDGSASCAVVDGHGRHGAVAAARLLGRLEAALALPLAGGSASAARLLPEAMLVADAAFLLDGEVDSRLCGATCLTLHLSAASSEGPAERRLAIAHAGDCRAVLGRRGDGGWQALRLTKDHVLSDPVEVQKVIAGAGQVRCPEHAPGQGATDFTGRGPPRLYSRLVPGAPGLAVSRGLGDALAQSCGLLARPAVLEAALGQEDLVLIAASDGVFDVLQDADVLRTCLPFRRDRDAAGAAAAVVAAAARGWAKFGGYRDDATCIVLFL